MLTVGLMGFHLPVPLWNAPCIADFLLIIFCKSIVADRINVLTAIYVHVVGIDIDGVIKGENWLRIVMAEFI